MKSSILLVIVAAALPLTASSAAADEKVKDCAFGGKVLHGKVQVVDSFPGMP